MFKRVSKEFTTFNILHQKKDKIPSCLVLFFQHKTNLIMWQRVKPFQSAKTEFALTLWRRSQCMLTIISPTHYEQLFCIVKHCWQIFSTYILCLYFFAKRISVKNCLEMLMKLTPGPWYTIGACFICDEQSLSATTTNCKNILWNKSCNYTDSLEVKNHYIIFLC